MTPSTRKQLALWSFAVGVALTGTSTHTLTAPSQALLIILRMLALFFGLVLPIWVMTRSR